MSVDEAVARVEMRLDEIAAKMAPLARGGGSEENAGEAKQEGEMP